MKLDTLLEQMHHNDVIEQINTQLEESSMAWSRKGTELVKKYVCSSGPRKGRKVSNMSQCAAPIDLKARLSMKRTKAAKGAKMARKAKKTKKINPASRRAAALNRMTKRKK
jgi:hypothetical protein